MRILAAPPTELAALPTAQPELLRLSPTVLPRPVLLPPGPTELAPPAPTELAPPVPPRRAQVRMALPPPAHPRPAQVRIALPRLALPPPVRPRPARARMALPRLALLPPVHPRPAQVRMVLPRRALPPPALPLPGPTELAPLVPPRRALPPPVRLLPLVLPEPAQVRMALPRLVLLLPALPRVAPAAGAHPVRPLPPALPRVARMVLLLATVPLAAPPLLPRATTAWVSTSLRVNPFPRGSLLIRTSRLPARAAISSPRRTRPIRTVAVTRRTWIIWTSSPVIRTRFPTVSTVRSRPQVVLTAAAPTALRRVTPSNRNPLLRATECLRGSLMILTVLALIVP